MAFATAADIPGENEVGPVFHGEPALAADALVMPITPTVPTTIGEENATNPFLRAPDLAIAAGAGNPAEAFRLVRAAKDGFKG